MTSLSMNTAYKVFVQGDLYYSSDYSFFAFNFVCLDFTSVHLGFAFIGVPFCVFSSISGLTVLGLVHLKSCIYMGNRSLPLHTAPASGGLLRKHIIFRYFKI